MFDLSFVIAVIASACVVTNIVYLYELNNRVQKLKEILEDKL